MRLLCKSACCGLIDKKLNFSPLSHVLNCVSIHRIIYKLVEVLLDIVNFALLPVVGVVGDVRLKVSTCCIAAVAVNFDELHNEVKVKSQNNFLNSVFPILNK